VTGTVTARPPRREHVGMASTEITFQVDGRPITFQPSAITGSDVGKLELGAKVVVARDPNGPTSADLGTPWRRYSGRSWSRGSTPPRSTTCSSREEVRPARWLQVERGAELP
jgi:hypothetical protein